MLYIQFFISLLQLSSFRIVKKTIIDLYLKAIGQVLNNIFKGTRI